MVREGSWAPYISGSFLLPRTTVDAVVSTAYEPLFSRIPSVVVSLRNSLKTRPVYRSFV
jgi:hypothetical protein